MRYDACILIAEDDDGHFVLIRRNLKRAGVTNNISRFRDGRETLDFFFQEDSKEQVQCDQSYILLLDIRMPKIDGTEVLRQFKNDPNLKKIPVIILTTSDNPDNVDFCNKLGANAYIVKPVEYDKFVETIHAIGTFLSIIHLPAIAVAQ